MKLIQYEKHYESFDEDELSHVSRLDPAEVWAMSQS